jgi:hypothetical protein
MYFAVLLEITIKEVIDAHDLRDDLRANDVLTDLIQTLKAMESKLREYLNNEIKKL